MMKYVHYKFRSRNLAHNDEWAHSLFPKGGFFVEVGACHGKHVSSCHELEKLGWDGICVEPNSSYYKNLIRSRKVPCENSCLLDKEGEIIFFECDGIGRTIDSLLKSKQWRKEVLRNGKITKKQTMTLENLLIKYDAPKTIEFLAMDIEGSELQVLRNFPFDKYKIIAIALEGNSCTRLLKRRGYVEVFNPWSLIDYEHHYILEEFLP
tara:strand:+ start:6654 stop:7277 length:624 start_codon:yes stop_codon:yes gene_type:complete